MTNPEQRTWRLKPEERGHIRTTIQLAVDGKWEDAYEGADASTTALMVRELNALEQELDTIRFARDFNQLQWNSCTVALKENMDTINALRTEVSRLTRMAVEAAELAEHYREENAALKAKAEK